MFERLEDQLERRGKWECDTLSFCGFLLGWRCRRGSAAPATEGWVSGESSLFTDVWSRFRGFSG